MTNTYYNIRYTCKYCHPNNEAMITTQNSNVNKLRCIWCKRFVKVNSTEESIVEAERLINA